MGSVSPRQAATSGALHGGRVAEFLAAPAEGANLLAELATDAPKPAAPKAEPAKPKVDPMLADLVGEAKRESAPAAPKAPVPKQSGSVDRGVIDDLLGGGGDRA